MRLDTYLRKEGLTLEAFAKLAGIDSRQTVWKYREGKCLPSPRNLLRIKEATGGQVTADDFAEHVVEAKPSRGRKRPLAREMAEVG